MSTIATHAPDEQPPRRRVRRAPAERREQLLDAALASFADLGYGAATMRDIAQRAQVTEGLIYHYFADKRELLGALLRERSPVASIAQLTSEAADRPIYDALTTVIDHVLNALERDPRVPLFLLSQSLHDIDVAGAWTEIFDTGLAAVSDFLRELQRRGKILAGPVEPAAQLILSSCLMHLIVSQRLPKSSFTANRGQFIAATVHQLVHGLQPRS